MNKEFELVKLLKIVNRAMFEAKQDNDLDFFKQIKERKNRIVKALRIIKKEQNVSRIN